MFSVEIRHVVHHFSASHNVDGRAFTMGFISAPAFELCRERLFKGERLVPPMSSSYVAVALPWWPTTTPAAAAAATQREAVCGADDDASSSNGTGGGGPCGSVSGSKAALCGARCCGGVDAERAQRLVLEELILPFDAHWVMAAAPSATAVAALPNTTSTGSSAPENGDRQRRSMGWCAATGIYETSTHDGGGAAADDEGAVASADAAAAICTIVADPQLHIMYALIGLSNRRFFWEFQDFCFQNIPPSSCEACRQSGGHGAQQPLHHARHFVAFPLRANPVVRASLLAATHMDEAAGYGQGGDRWEVSPFVSAPSSPTTSHPFADHPDDGGGGEGVPTITAQAQFPVHSASQGKPPTAFSEEDQTSSQAQRAGAGEGGGGAVASSSVPPPPWSEAQLYALPKCVVGLDRLNPVVGGLIGGPLRDRTSGITSHVCGSVLHDDNDLDGDDGSSGADLPPSSVGGCTCLSRCPCKICQKFVAFARRNPESLLTADPLDPTHTPAAGSSPHHRPSLACHACGITDDVWLCLSCGVVGCSRYRARHARTHYQRTRHPFSMCLATQEIWDYDADDFAHRWVARIHRFSDVAERQLIFAPGRVPTAEASALGHGIVPPVVKKGHRRGSQGDDEGAGEPHDAAFSMQDFFASPKGDNAHKKTHHKMLHHHGATGDKDDDDAAGGGGGQLTGLKYDIKLERLCREYTVLLQNQMEVQRRGFEARLGPMVAERRLRRRVRQQQEGVACGRPVDATTTTLAPPRSAVDEADPIGQYHAALRQLREVQGDLSTAHSANRNAQTSEASLRQSIAEEKGKVEKILHDRQQEVDHADTELAGLREQLADMQANIALRTRLQREGGGGSVIMLEGNNNGAGRGGGGRRAQPSSRRQ